MGILYRLWLETKTLITKFKYQGKEEPGEVLDQISDKTKESIPADSGLVRDGETSQGLL